MEYPTFKSDETFPENSPRDEPEDSEDLRTIMWDFIAENNRRLLHRVEKISGYDMGLEDAAQM